MSAPMRCSPEICSFTGLEPMAQPPGRETSASPKRASSASGFIEVRISDEGIGIPEENLKQIFEPFYTTRDNGSGLGLSISYKIIEAHDGDISVESQPDKGTTFTVQLPTA